MARKAALNLLQSADDDGEQIVEIVGDPAGELADGLHLLRLAQRLLGFGEPRLRRQPLGHVVNELIGADATSVLVA